MLLQRAQALVGILQVKPFRLQRAAFLQPAINAAEPFVQAGSEQIPGLRRLLRSGLCKQLDTGLHQDRI